LFGGWRLRRETTKGRHPKQRKGNPSLVGKWNPTMGKEAPVKGGRTPQKETIIAM